MKQKVHGQSEVHNLLFRQICFVEAKTPLKFANYRTAWRIDPLLPNFVFVMQLHIRT